MFADRMSRIAPSGTTATGDLVAKLRKEGIDIISFALGEPDFDTPRHIVEAAYKALKGGYTHYTPTDGLPELREAIGQKSQIENGIPCDASNVMVTPTKFGLFTSIVALVNHGDEVVLSDPAFVSYFQVIDFVDGKLVPVKTSQEDDFRLLPENVAEAITPKTKAILLNTPCNPTGAVATKEDLKGIADLACDHDFLVLSDEIYEKIIYEGEHHSIASFDNMFDRTITVNGFSKAYAMTGWRLGWMVAHENILREVRKIQQHSITCAVSFGQKAAVDALKGTQEPVKEMVSEFKSRRDLIVRKINTIPGLSCNMPKGAFYAFAKFDFDISSIDFTKYLLEEAHVAVTPGASFGQCGEGHVRFSYATSRKNIIEGLARVEEAVAKL
jgi:aspartate aminotransferase